VESPTKRVVNQLNPIRPNVDGATRIFLLTRLHSSRIIGALNITVRSDWDVAELAVQTERTFKLASELRQG